MAIQRIVACLAALSLATAGCGDDDGDQGQPRSNKPPIAAAAAAAPGSKTLLVEKPHIEDVINCPAPDKPTDLKNGKCDPKAAHCGPHLYCLTLAQGSYCEACPERDGIRHSFKDRDFAVEQNRDPFQSFLLPQFSIGKPSDAMPLDQTTKCQRKDQLVATSYSYNELKLVGIVAQGTQRKVLMMGGPLGYIIKRGDCVGKEKAVVKDIGTGYITFQVEPDPVGGSQRPAEEYSVQLNPTQLTVAEPEAIPTPRTIAPVVAPPGAGSPPGVAPAGAVPATAPPAMVQPGAPSAAAAPAMVQPGMPPVAAPQAPPVIISPTVPAGSTRPAEAMPRR